MSKKFFRQNQIHGFKEFKIKRILAFQNNTFLIRFEKDEMIILTKRTLFVDTLYIALTYNLNQFIADFAVVQFPNFTNTVSTKLVLD